MLVDQPFDDARSSIITRQPLLMAMDCQEFVIDFAAKQLIKKKTPSTLLVFMRVYLSESSNKI